MARTLLGFLVVMSSACFASRRQFVEPRWGDAPAPLNSEITDITVEHARCRSNCVYERIVFRRDGRATRTFRTGGRVDSLFTASIDSLKFARLATGVLRSDFFNSPESDGHQEPLASESYVVSAASLCRRRVVTIGQAWIQGGHYMAVLVPIDSAGAAMKWERCCRVD